MFVCSHVILLSRRQVTCLSSTRTDNTYRRNLHSVLPSDLVFVQLYI